MKKLEVEDMISRPLVEELGSPDGHSTEPNSIRLRDHADRTFATIKPRRMTHLDTHDTAAGDVRRL